MAESLLVSTAITTSLLAYFIDKYLHIKVKIGNII